MPHDYTGNFIIKLVTSEPATWVTYHFCVNPVADQWKPQNLFAADMKIKRTGSGIPPCQPIAYRNLDMTLLDNRQQLCVNIYTTTFK